MTAADLRGMALPAIAMQSTAGGFVDLSRHEGLALLIIHPYTGKAGIPDPPGWDTIDGAHGSTPQLLAYNKLRAEFEDRGVSLWGVSLSSRAWQREFVRNNGLSFALLSDEWRKFTAALQLSVFAAGDRAFLRRRTLLARRGLVMLDRRQVDPPADDASTVLQWLDAR